jgi:gluconolactonase
MAQRGWIARVVVCAGLAAAGCTTPPAAEPAAKQEPAPEVAEPVAILTSTEGPTADREGSIYFTFGGIGGGKILKWTDGERRETQPGLLTDPGRVEVFRQWGAGGLIFDHEWRLLACERGPKGDRSGVTRTDMKTGKFEWLADNYQGKRFGGTNDLTIDSQGRIYFTDRPPMKPPPDQTGINAVYRIDSDGTVTQILKEPEIERPNGIVISPDDKTLYLIEAHIAKGGARNIRAYDLQPDGSVTNMRVLYDFAPGRGGDGMTVDTQGNLYVAAGLHLPRGSAETMDNQAGMYVISPQGKLLRFISVPEDLLTNVCFGGPDMKTLYVTAGKTLYRIRNDIEGTGR